MWILFSIAAAFFAGGAAIFAKVGVNDIDSNLATAIRTTIILAFSIFIVTIFSSFSEFTKLNTKTLLFLILSGFTTAFLWLSYFKALKIGNVNLVSPVDKSSIVLTFLLSFFFLKEKITIFKVTSMILIIVGTLFMITKSTKKNSNNRWLFYAILTAIFTSLTTILGKVGVKNIDSNFATMIRTLIVFFVIWIIVLLKKKTSEIKKITKKGWVFLFLSAITTAFSWLCYFKALQNGEASVVFAVEKLSIVFVILFSYLFLKEKTTKKSIFGLGFIVLGTILLMIKQT